MLHRRRLCGGEKKGDCVGMTRQGNGSKLTAIADRAGLPIAVQGESAQPHAGNLVAGTLASGLVEGAPERLNGDRVYDSALPRCRTGGQRD